MIGYNLTIINTASSATLWYSADGTDPRAVGGSTAPTAVNGGTQATVNVLQTSIVCDQQSDSRW